MHCLRSQLTHFLFSLIVAISPLTTSLDASTNEPMSIPNQDASPSTTTNSSDGSQIVRIDKADGTTITTVYKSDGSSIKTINNADGSSVKTIDNADGSSVKVTTYTDGSWVKTTTGVDGTITTETSHSPSNVKSDLVTSTTDSEIPSSIPDPGASSGEDDAPTSTETPSQTNTPTEDRAPHLDAFKEKSVPLNIKLIPVYINNDESGHVLNGPESPFVYLSESCISGNEYCAFLRAVATRADPYGLYSEEMSRAPLGKLDFKSQRRAPSPHVAQIKRTTNQDGTFSYDLVDPDAEVKIEVPGRSYTIHRGDLPVSNVNLHDAARFCNWMHNNQPVGPEGLNTTESGAYLLDNGFDSYMNSFPASKTDLYRGIFTGIQEQEGARWVIPSMRSYLGEDRLLEGSSKKIHVQSGLYDNYGMFYSHQELWEWTSTRGQPLTQSDIFYGDKNHPHDHNLITKYHLINSPNAFQEMCAVTYKSDRAPKGEHAPAATKDGFTTFRIMKIENPLRSQIQ